MNPALVFGLQVETLISRDIAMLEREKIPASEPDSPDSTVLQRKRAVEHAKLVVEQMGQRSSKRRCTKRLGKISDQNTEIFRFMDLPSEIQDMIYIYYFTNSSGEKPGLMWAFKINGVKITGDFYDAAEKVYYTTNNWTFRIRDCVKNSILGNMDQVHVEMIRNMTIEIPKEIQACTVLSSAISRPVNINELTLSARSDTGIRRAIHELMPGFKHLRRITLSIQRPRDPTASLRRDNLGTEYYKLFRPVKEMLDRALGQDGKLIQETARVQEWRWETDGLKVFKIMCPKKHIKFE